MKHFSHPHPLELSEIVGDENDEEVICSGCEENLKPGEEFYSCIKKSEEECQFSLHKSCSEKIPEKFRHKSHPEHELILIPEPDVYSNIYGCNACGEKFIGFNYTCTECYGIYTHPKCAFMPEIVKRDDHEHSLWLYYSSPLPEDDHDTSLDCHVCQEYVPRDSWNYYCAEDGFGTHFACINAEAIVPTVEEEEEGGGGEELQEEEEVQEEEEEVQEEGGGEEGEVEEEGEEEESIEAMQYALQNRQAILDFQANMSQMNARFMTMLASNPW
ncbi:OLC1v1001680C1 [Oldenlandia corymbosa var. corymbosa]|uniref:OLC1v1001680C1 n=1 Tax=Oldenlandia corymbosa var. corymbosa TaxID=529605 RepID=A0AAV1D700_OLDCO|nr:OLC1v1001680C1 [Oldenlandia corymbosa var. corymbosa]